MWGGISYTYSQAFNLIGQKPWHGWQKKLVVYGSENHVQFVPVSFFYCPQYFDEHGEVDMLCGCCSDRI